jgi:tetratricopeptide (TPR) repeat protein
MAQPPPDPPAPAEAAALLPEPKIFRTMLFDTIDGGRRVPQVGTDKNMLGARLPPSDPADVHPDANGRVAPAGEGLSVSPSLKSMPLGLVPERLRDRRPGARGSDDLRLFRLGEGRFVQELLILLHEEMKQGRQNGPRADEIRDEMDLLWHELDDDERDLFDELSEDLYLIEGKRIVTPMKEGETIESVRRALTSAFKDHRDRDTVALARKLGDGDPMLPYVLGRCWERLGFLRGAVCFYDFAYENARKPVYAVSALEALVRGKRFAEAMGRVDEIEGRLIVDGTLLLEAASVLHRVAQVVEEGSRAELYGRVVRMVEVAWIDLSALPSLRAGALIAAGFSYEHLQDPDRALRSFERAATIHPSDATLLAHGLALLGTNRRQAIALLVEAARRGTPFDWAYLYAAQNALTEQRFADAERFCDLGLSRTDRAEVRGRLYEWSAIAAATLGQHAEVVRDRFDRALAELPFDPTVRKNAAAFAEFSGNRSWNVEAPEEVAAPNILALERAMVSRRQSEDAFALAA